MYALGSKSILEMPFLFRTGFPFRMIYGPLLYIYTQKMLYPKKKLSRISYLHFVPTFMVVVVLAPDYLSDSTYKFEVINGFYEQNSIFIEKPSGLIPPGTLQPVVISYGLIYCLATFWVIITYKKSKWYPISTNSKVVQWVSLFTAVLLIYILCQLIQFFFLSIDSIINTHTQMIQSVSLLILMGYLLIADDIIENMDGCLNHSTSEPPKSVLPLPIDNTNSAFISLMDQCMAEKQPFLNADFSLKDMAKNLGLSSKRLSIELNKTYGINFNELINRYKIHYLIELVKAENLKNIKLEALIKKAGFRYRSSFYISFKKILNTTPSFYFKDLEKTSKPN